MRKAREAKKLKQLESSAALGGRGVDVGDEPDSQVPELIHVEESDDEYSDGRSAVSDSSSCDDGVFVDDEEEEVVMVFDEPICDDCAEASESEPARLKAFSTPADESHLGPA